MKKTSTNNEFQVKPWDNSINRSKFLEIVNPFGKFIDPEFFVELNEDVTYVWFGKDTDLSKDVLRFESNEGKIVGFAGLTTFSGFMPSWRILYAILPEYFQSELPRILIEESISLGRKRGISNLLFTSHGLVSAHFDNVLKQIGLSPIHYSFNMHLTDYQSFNLSKIPQNVIIRNIKEIDDYSDSVYVLNEAFRSSFEYKESTIEDYKLIVETNRKLLDYEHCLAYKNDKLIGNCDIMINPNDFNGCILCFSVLPRFHRQGIGSALFSFAVDSLRKKGSKKIDLGVEAENEKALSLYKKFGFQVQEHLTQKVYRIL